MGICAQKDQRHVALLEAREELNDIRRTLELLRARDRVRDFMSPLDVPALQRPSENGLSKQGRLAQTADELLKHICVIYQ